MSLNNRTEHHVSCELNHSSAHCSSHARRPPAGSRLISGIRSWRQHALGLQPCNHRVYQNALAVRFYPALTVDHPFTYPESVHDLKPEVSVNISRVVIRRLKPRRQIVFASLLQEGLYQASNGTYSAARLVSDSPTKQSCFRRSGTFIRPIWRPSDQIQVPMRSVPEMFLPQFVDFGSVLDRTFWCIRRRSWFLDARW